MRTVLIGMAATLAAVGVLVATQVRPDVPLETLRARYADGASQIVMVHGMPVHLRDEGSGPPLVLLHGTGASLHTWDGWAERLRDSFRVVRFDLPGFGLTGPHVEDDYRIAAYVDFLTAVLDTLGLERVHLAGNSLGGFIAWRFALAHPERVGRLVLVDASGAPVSIPGGSPIVFRLARVPLLNQIFTVVTPRSVLEMSLRDVYADDHRVTQALVDRYDDLARRAGNRAAFVTRANTPPEPDRFAALADYLGPVLLQWGAADTWIPLAHADTFAAVLPNDTLIVYSDAGHVPMEERPAATAYDVRQFLLADTTFSSLQDYD